MSRVDRFHQSFNVAFETTTSKYKNVLEKLVRKPLAVIVTVVIGIAVLVVTMFTTKSGLVPDEDTGTVFCTVTLRARVR